MNIKTKQCNECGLIKTKEEFFPSQFERKDGRKSGKCSECFRKYAQLHKEDKIKYDKQYYQTHREEKIKYQKEYRTDPINKKKILKRNNEREKERIQEDIQFKLKKLISKMIAYHLKHEGSSKGGRSTLNYLPYSMEEFWNHIKNQFEPWMNKDNHGSYDSKTWNNNDPSTWKWQLDHIIPHSTFRYTSMEDEEFRECWSLENLRPLSAKQNILDGSTKIRHKKKKPT